MRYIRFGSHLFAGLLTAFTITSTTALPVSAYNETTDPTPTCKSGTYVKAYKKCGSITPGPSGTASFKPSSDPTPILTCPQGYELGAADKKCHGKNNSEANEQQKADEVYSRLGSSVDTFKKSYLEKFPDKNEEDFKKVVLKCWNDSRSNAANAGRYDPNSGGSEATKKLFADCMSKETGVKPDDARNATSNIDTDHVNGASAAANQKSCEESGGKWENNACKTTQEEAEQEKSCGTELEGIGWYMCAALDNLVKVVDESWELFEGLLRTQPLRTTNPGTGDPNTVYLTWSNLRNIANGLLVVFFLIIIFSQITSFGLNNYGVKKALPRLIVVAILVNISFFLMQVSFDIVNILGNTLADLITSSVGSFKPNVGTLLADIATLGLVSGGAVVGGIALSAGIGAGAGFLFLFIMLIPAITAFIAGLVAMIIRLGLVEVLAVFAPIALVAYILPNTQFLFDKWRKAIFGLLVLYPTAAIYYGALKFTAFMFISNTEPGDTLYRLIGILMLLLGSGVVAWIALKSNAITGKIAGSVQGALDKATAPVRTGLSVTAADMRKEKMGELLHGKNLRGVGGIMQRGARAFDRQRRARELRTGIHQMAGQKQFEDSFLNNPGMLGSLGKTAEGQAVIQENRTNAIRRASAQFRDVASAKELGQHLQEAIANNDSIKAQAVQGILATSKGSSGIEELNNSLIAAQRSGTLEHGSFMDKSLRADLRDNHGAILGKDWGLKYWANDIKGSETIDAARDAATKGAILGVNEEGLPTGGMENRELTNMTKYAQERLFQIAQRDSNNNIIRDASGNVVTSSVDPSKILTKSQIESISTPAGESAEALPGPLLEKLQDASYTKQNASQNIKAKTRINRASVNRLRSRGR